MRFLMVSATFSPFEEAIFRRVFSIIWGKERFYLFKSVKDALSDTVSVPEIQGSQALTASEI